MNDLSIVIVDDDEHDYEFLSDILNEFSSPLNKVWLKDGEEVINYLDNLEKGKAQTSFKKVFFLDVNLPKINGLELVKIIKNHYIAKEDYVIMLSGSKTKSDMETAKKNGSDCYLEKPFGKQQINEFSEFLYSKLSSLI
jgi:CheY-like chemotaxis protein